MIEYFLIVLWGLDILFTYFGILKIKKIYPKKKYSDLEYNGMNVYFWNKFGLKKGTLISILCQVPLLFLMIILTRNYLNYLYMIFGMYTVVFYIHYLDYWIIRKKEMKLK